MDLGHEDFQILRILEKPLSEVRSSRNRVQANGREKDPTLLKALVRLERLGLVERTSEERTRGRVWVEWEITEQGSEVMKSTPRPVRLMLPHQAEDLRKGGVTDQGVQFEKSVSTGRSICRACGQKIPKGEECLTGYFDFLGNGSWTATKCFLHLQPCLKGT